MTTAEVIARNLSVARKMVGLTQADVAERVGWSSHSILSQIEAGKRRVPVDELSELARVYGKSIDWFLDEDASGEDFVALARAQASSGEVRHALAEAERLVENYVLLRKLLSKKRA